MTAPFSFLASAQTRVSARVSAHFRPRAALRTALLGLLLGAAWPALADNLADAQGLVKQGQYPRALEKVDAYLADRPKDAQGRFLKGLILTEMGKPTEAVAVFTKLTEDYPELPEPYNNLAVLYAQQKQYDKARKALEMAIRTHPSYAIAYENLGDIYAKLASQAYDKALQLDSSNAGAQSKMALIRDLISTPAKPGAKSQPPASAPVAPVPPPPQAAKHSPAPAVAQAPVPAAPKASAPAATAPAPTAKLVTPIAPAAAPAKATENPPAAPTAAKADAASEEVAKTLNNWAEAWSRKDVKAYLAHYAPEFRPPKGLSRKSWEAERKNRIAGKTGKIAVTYEQLQIGVDGDKATARFKQHYKAGSLDTSTGKILVFIRSAGKWLIQEESYR